jgi:hypothetical protein
MSMNAFSRRLGRLQIVVAALLMGVWSTQPLPAGAADGKDVRRGDDFVAELKRSWPTVGLDSLASTEFDCATFKYAVFEKSVISRKDLEALVENIKTAWRATGDLKDIVAVSKHLPLSQEFMAENWAWAHSVTRGQFWRSRFERGADPAKTFFVDYCFAFGKEVDYIPACKEANIYERKSLYTRLGPKDTILVPPLEDGTAVVAGDLDPDLVTLKTIDGSTEYYAVLQASRSTKLLNWVKTFQGNETLRSYDWQFGFAEYTGGDGSKRVFPAITVFASLSPQQMVMELDIIVKKSVTFNHPVPDKTFRVAVPKEIWVHLYKGNGPYTGEEVGYEYMHAPVEDVLKEGPPLIYQKIAAEKRALERRSTDRGWLYWMAVGNLIIVGVGFFGRFAVRRFRR